MLIFTSFRTFLFLLKADAIHCTPWPEYKSNCKPANGQGEEWKQLDEDTKVTSECESLCMQHASGDGCCNLDNKYGCYWRPGSIAIMDKETDGISVTCVTQVSGEYYLILSK